jgi:hypothetical protein
MWGVFTKQKMCIYLIIFHMSAIWDSANWESAIWDATG